MTDNPNLLDDEALRLIGNYVKTKAQALAPSFVAPFITEVEIKTNKEGDYSIKTGLDLAKIPEGNRAKSARAYEYGSGIHAQRNIKSKHQVGKYIKIEPKKPGGVLVFSWDRVENNKNPVHFKSVMHPGVEAANNGKGYLRLALTNSKEYIKEVVGKDAAKNIKFKLRAVFSRPGGTNK